MNSTLITRPLLRQLREELDAAAQAIFEKHGFKSVPSTCSYTEDRATFKVEMARVREDGSVASKEVDAFAMAPLFGLKVEALGSTFTFRGSAYTITGLKPAASKFPFMATRSDGRTFKFPARIIQAARPDLKSND